MALFLFLFSVQVKHVITFQGRFWLYPLEIRIVMISSYCSLVFLKSYTGRFSVPSGLRKSTCRTWAAVLAQETCGCLGTWGRWQVQRTPVMANTSLLPKFQNSYLEMKTFLGVYFRYDRRVRARSCLLTETRQILSFCHDKCVLVCVRWKSSTHPSRKDMISDILIHKLTSFSLPKTICVSLVEALFNWSGDCKYCVRENYA